MKKYDLHTHNGYSRCVKSSWSIKDGWQKAQSLGITKLGITNHVHYNSPVQNFLHNQRAEIERLGLEGNVLLGVELDIDSEEGICVLNRETYEILDFVIAGPHNQPIGFLTFKDVDEEDEADYFESMRKILTNSLNGIDIDVWVHPFYQEFGAFGDYYWNKYMKNIFFECLEICANRGIAVELTPDYHRDINYPGKIDKWKTEWDYFKGLYNSVHEMYDIAANNKEILFSTSSDAHNLKNIGDISIPLYFIRILGISDSRIIKIKSKYG